MFSIQKHNVRQGKVALPNGDSMFIYQTLEDNPELKHIKYQTPIHELFKEMWYVVKSYAVELYCNNFAFLLRLINPVYFMNSVFDYNLYYYADRKNKSDYYVVNDGDEILVLELEKDDFVQEMEEKVEKVEKVEQEMEKEVEKSVTDIATPTGGQSDKTDKSEENYNAWDAD